MTTTYTSSSSPTLDSAYLSRHASLSVLLSTCYTQLLGDPALSLLADSNMLFTHKQSSIEKLLQSLIDKQNQLLICKLCSEVELYKEEVRGLRMASQSREIKEEFQEVKELLLKHGFQWVGDLGFTVGRVLGEVEFMRRSLNAREELIEKQSKEIARLRVQLSQPQQTSNRNSPTTHLPLQQALSQTPIHLLHTPNGQALAQILHLRSQLQRLSNSSIKQKFEKAQVQLQLVIEQNRQLKQQQQNLTRTIFELQSSNTRLKKQLQVMEFENRNVRAQLDEVRKQGEAVRRGLEEAQRVGIESTVKLQQEANRTSKLQNKYRQQLELLQKQNQELRQAVITTVNQQQQQQQQQRTQKSSRQYSQQTKHNQYVEELQRLCNQRVQQCELEIEEKDREIVRMTRQVVEYQMKINLFEQMMKQLEEKNRRQEEVNQTLMHSAETAKQTLLFQRRLHQQQKLQLKKMQSSEKDRSIRQFMELQDTVKRYGSQRRDYREPRESTRIQQTRSTSRSKIHRLNEKVREVVLEFRCFQSVCRSEVRAMSQLFGFFIKQLQIDWNPAHKSQHPSTQLLQLRQKLLQNQQYILHLDHLLTS